MMPPKRFYNYSIISTGFCQEIFDYFGKKVIAGIAFDSNAQAPRG
jgi:hypothetical protein